MEEGGGYNIKKLNTFFVHTWKENEYTSYFTHQIKKNNNSN